MKGKIQIPSKLRHLPRDRDHELARLPNNFVKIPFDRWLLQLWDNELWYGNTKVEKTDQPGEGGFAYRWGNKSPDHRISSDIFSIRFMRTISLEKGMYTFTARADDGIRLWIDQKKIIDTWSLPARSDANIYNIQLNAGPHTIRMDYSHIGGNAYAFLTWRQETSTGM